MWSQARWSILKDGCRDAQNTREESYIVLCPLAVMKHREEKQVKTERALAYSSRAYSLSWQASWQGWGRWPCFPVMDG